MFGWGSVHLPRARGVALQMAKTQEVDDNNRSYWPPWFAQLDTLFPSSHWRTVHSLINSNAFITTRAGFNPCRTQEQDSDCFAGSNSTNSRLHHMCSIKCLRSYLRSSSINLKILKRSSRPWDSGPKLYTIQWCAAWAFLMKTHAVFERHSG